VSVDAENRLVVAATAKTAETAIGDGRSQIEGTIRERPLAAVALAVVAGFLLATLLRR
jgi:hypothetical protein